jgi:hypothetical protein
VHSIRWQQFAQADIEYAAVVAIVVTLPRLMIPFGSPSVTVRETKKAGGAPHAGFRRI